jgi:hypothetical protein
MLMAVVGVRVSLGIGVQAAAVIVACDASRAGRLVRTGKARQASQASQARYAAASAPDGDMTPPPAVADAKAG